MLDLRTLCLGGSLQEALLHEACYYSDTQSARILIEKGADVNRSNEDDVSWVRIDTGHFSSLISMAIHLYIAR